jgi:hypothetical protein
MQDILKPRSDPIFPDTLIIWETKHHFFLHSSMFHNDLGPPRDLRNKRTLSFQRERELWGENLGNNMGART